MHKDLIKKNIVLSKKEFPKGVKDFDFNIHLAAASSGSSVIEDKVQVESIKGQQRKLTAFEMESFSVYESARVSAIKPKYFSAKAIVDNGIIKGDDFHSVAAMLSAKVVYEIIKSGLAF
jgi:nucleoside phosphorylase